MISLLLIPFFALADAEMPIDGLAKCKLGKKEFNVILASEPGKEKKSEASGSADLFIEDGRMTFIEKAAGNGAEYSFTTPQSGSVCDKTAGFKLGKSEIALVYKKTVGSEIPSLSIAVYSLSSRKIIARETDLVEFPRKISLQGKKLVIDPPKPEITTLPVNPIEQSPSSP